jgi:predicted peptidase
MKHQETMTKPARCFVFLFSFLIFLISFFQEEEVMSQQTTKYFKVWTGKEDYLEARCLLYLPEGYDALERNWPLLLFLHGKGESGDMIELVKKHGPPMLIGHGTKFPFIVISPQCPEEHRWSIEVLDMVLTEMLEQYRVDTDRIYVTGLSMGGEATWKLAIAYPDRFAAIVPICGWTDPQFAPVIKKLPVWVFHGAKDDVVPLSESEDMVNALKGLGSPVKFTVYPEANHDSWTETYNNPEMWEWLGEQSLGGH